MRSIEQNRKWVKECNARKQAVVFAYKTEHGCDKCGERDPVCLEFHHVDKTKKSMRLRANDGKIHFTRLTWEQLLSEMSKCQVLCANCHRKLEYAERERVR